MFENHLHECCNILQCVCHVPFSWTPLDLITQVSVIRPYTWAFPWFLGLHWGTGSIMEERASQDAGTKEGWRILEVGEDDATSWQGKLWEWICTSLIHAFYPFTISHSKLLFLIKTYTELRCSECARRENNNNNNSPGEAALVYSRLLINAV